MATLTAESLSQDRRFHLLPYGVSSARQRNTRQTLSNGQKIHLLNYYPFDAPRGTIAIDYTSPQSAELNAINYTQRRIPFVMGTTVGNRDAVEQAVRNSDVSAVIAPNMAIEVVELQDELANLRASSPDHFQDWHMAILESHQSSKVDANGIPIVSGTAIALRETFLQLGAVMDDEIVSIRDKEEQIQIGIQNLDAHGYHCVDLTGPNGETRIFATLIEGRQPYAEGTLAAASFSAKRTQEGSRGEVYTMSDVVRDLRRAA